MRDHSGLTFSLGEYERRLRELRCRMEERKLDVVMITDPENITYLTGYQTTGYSYFQCLIVPLDQDAFMVTRLLEESNVHARTWVELTRPYNDTGDAIGTLWNALVEFKLDAKHIGYERDSYFFPAYQQARMASTLTEAGLWDCCGIVEEGRIVKSAEELEVMAKAARATEAGMVAGIAAAAEGVTENDIAAEIHHAMFKAGGEYPAVAPYVTSGERCCIGHATWEGRTVGRDECVFLEIGGCFRRYHTAMMRTVYIGKPSRAVLDAEQLVQEAVQVMLSTMRTGVTADQVDFETRRVLNQFKGSGGLVTRSGYSIGIAYAPSWDEGYILSLKPGERTVLQQNMTFHIIPWLFGIDGNKVMGLSETVYVTDDGARSLFNFERKLVVKE